MDKASLAPPDPLLYLVHYLCCAEDKKKQGSHSDWKIWKNEKAFSTQRKVGGNFEQTRKVREFQTNVTCCFFSHFSMNCVLFAISFQFKKKHNKTLKDTGENGEKYGKSQGILSVGKSGNHERKDDKIGIAPVSKSDVFLVCDRVTELLINLPAVSSNSNSSEKLKL